MKCKVCGEAAEIIRRHSGEAYCKRHMKSKILASITHTIQKIHRLGYDRTRIVVIDLGDKYRTEVITKKLGESDILSTLDFEIYPMRGICPSDNEAVEVTLRFDRLLRSMSQKERTTVIIPIFADELAHHILKAELEGLHGNLGKVITPKETLLPLLSFFTEEALAAGLPFERTISQDCETTHFIDKLIKERPTTVFSIIKYEESLVGPPGFEPGTSRA